MRNEVVTRLHSELRGNYPATWNADTDVLCQRVLRQLQGEIGDARLRTACLSCMASEQFFNEANLRRYIPDAPAVRNRCARCKKSDGWIELPIPGRKVPEVARCNHDGTVKCIASGVFGGRTFDGAWRD